MSLLTCLRDWNESAVTEFAQLLNRLGMSHTLKGPPSFTSFALIHPSEQVVRCVVLQPLSFQLLLFHSSVLEPDFHLSLKA